jgi:membrane peptidoglycan carboxypeptidase
LDDVDIATRAFTEHLFHIFQSNIPHRDKVIKPKDMPWFNKNIKTAINKRDKLYKKFVTNNNVENHNRLKTQTLTVNTLVDQAKQRYMTNLCNSLSNQNAGSKDYWLLIRKLLGSKFISGMPTLEGANGSVDFF